MEVVELSHRGKTEISVKLSPKHFPNDFPVTLVLEVPVTADYCERHQTVNETKTRRSYSQEAASR